MSVIAVAGGTGKVGRAIVDALVSQGKHKVIVLSRETSESKEKEIGAPILAVDYTNAESLTTLFETNKIEVLISTLETHGGPSPEHALVQAAAKSSITKRYIPSIWAIKYTDEMTTYFPPIKTKLDILAALAATTLEYTSILNGYFIDYFVVPKVKSYMPPVALAVDIQHNFAGVPGTGDIPVVFSHTFDVALFVAALLDQPKWDKESYVIGDRVTWNEFIRLAEEVKGAKFEVVYDSLEKLRRGEITELPSHPGLYPFFPKEALQKMFAAFGIMFETGAFDMRPGRSLNDAFPEIKARGVKELLGEAWGTV